MSSFNVAHIFVMKGNGKHMNRWTPLKTKNRDWLLMRRREWAKWSMTHSPRKVPTQIPLMKPLAAIYKARLKILGALFEKIHTRSWHIVTLSLFHACPSLQL